MFIDFESVEQARRAMNSYQNEIINGKITNLSFACNNKPTPPAPHEKNTPKKDEMATLLVKNLTNRVTMDSLKSLFKGCSSVRIPTYADTGRPKRYFSTCRKKTTKFKL